MHAEDVQNFENYNKNTEHSYSDTKQQKKTFDSMKIVEEKNGLLLLLLIGRVER